MANAPVGKSELAYFFGPNQTKSLVLSRSYGEIVSIILDDTLVDETAVLRIHAKHFNEFLESFSPSVIIAGMDAQYNALDMYLTTMNQPVLGPLTSARAVMAMASEQCSPSVAIKKALDQGAMLVKAQIDRVQRLDTHLQNG